MIEAATFLIALLASYIGAFIPGVSSSLSISSLILLGIPPQISKTTFQIGAIGLSLGGFYQLIREKQLRMDIVGYLCVLSFIGGAIGGKILISIPVTLLIKLTGLFMVILLLINIIMKDLGISRIHISKKKRNISFFIFFCLNIFGSIFPMGIGLLYQFMYMLGFGLTHLETRAMGKATYLPFLLGFIVPVILSGMLRIELILIYAIGSYIGSHFGIKHGIQIGNKILKDIITAWLLIIGLYFLFFA